MKQQHIHRSGLFLIICLLIMHSVPTKAGNLTKKINKSEKIRFGGYLKDLRTISHNQIIDDLFVDNLIHNRLNLSWFPHKNIKFDFALRTRLHYGGLVKLLPNFAESLESDYPIDLSWLIFNRKSAILHNEIDRLSFQYKRDRWEVKVGRQRINWGVGLVWNPNDLFNSYSFFDFDYEERPGTDAIDLKYFFNGGTELELAVNYATEFEEMIAASRLRFAIGRFDLQLISGLMHEQIVAGAGWSGHLKNAGFKGEFSFFQPISDRSDEELAVTASIYADFSFGNGFYINGGFLYNKKGDVESNPLQLLNFEIGPDNLSQDRYSLFFQFSKRLHPLISASVAQIYSPVSHNYFLNPGITFSVTQDIDLDLLAQLIFGEWIDNYQSIIELAFIRLKYSF